MYVVVKFEMKLYLQQKIRAILLVVFTDALLLGRVVILRRLVKEVLILAVARNRGFLWLGQSILIQIYTYLMTL